EETQTDMYPAATMESANATIEETYYSNVATTRQSPPVNYPASSGTNRKVAMLSGDESQFPGGIKIGPAIVLKVMAGDKFNLIANSWWFDDTGFGPANPTNPYVDLLAAISGSIAG